MNHFTLTPYKLSFGIVCCAIFLQVVLGEWFYKSRVGPIYFTELFILIALFIILPKLLLSFKIPRVVPVYLFIILSLIYFFYSLLQEREIHWILRQSAIFLYATVAIISYVHVKRYYDNIDWYFFFNLLGIIGAISTRVCGYFPGHAQATARVLFLLGYSFWVFKVNGVFKKIILAFLCAAILIGNTSITITPFVILWFSLFIRYRKLRPLLIFTGILISIAMFALVSGLADQNASWRYLFWYSIVIDSWQRGGFLLGKGFGVSFFSEGSIYFDRLIWQVTRRGDYIYKLMSVPPHNGILTILTHTGIIGIIIFLYPLFKGFKLSLSGKLNFTGHVFLLSVFGYFVLLSANQFLEVPYAAVTFWMVYGALLACIQISEKQGGNVFNPNNSRIT